MPDKQCNADDMCRAILERDNAFVIANWRACVNAFAMTPLVGFSSAHAAVVSRNLTALECFGELEAHLLTKSRLRIHSPYGSGALVIPAGQDVLHLAIFRCYTDIAAEIIRRWARCVSGQCNAAGQTHLEVLIGLGANEALEEFLIANLTFFAREIRPAQGAPNVAFQLIKQGRTALIERIIAGLNVRSRALFEMQFFALHKKKTIFKFAKTAQTRQFLNTQMPVFYRQIQKRQSQNQILLHFISAYPKFEDLVVQEPELAQQTPQQQNENTTVRSQQQQPEQDSQAN